MIWIKPIYQCVIIQNDEVSVSKTHSVNSHIGDDRHNAENNQEHKIEENTNHKKCSCWAIYGRDSLMSNDNKMYPAQ